MAPEARDSGDQKERSATPTNAIIGRTDTAKFQEIHLLVKLFRNGRQFLPPLFPWNEKPLPDSFVGIEQIDKELSPLLSVGQIRVSSYVKHQSLPPGVIDTLHACD
jgi:hypothetical protein